MMVDLDSELKLPETILSEQLLQNAGLSEDHKLLVRTAIQGDMTWSKVCEELVAQHCRIHERESDKGKGVKGFNKNAYKGFMGSQSLGGYEDIDDYDYDTAEHHEEEEPIFQVYQAMIDEGLDEDDQEALDHAAEVLHYRLRTRSTT